MNTRFEPSRGLTGELRAPPDKSVSHRAALLGAMASEPVRIANYLHAADTISTLEAVRALGALVEVRDGETVIRGTGLREAREPDGPIDVGNAGTLMRLLPGWLAAQEGRSFTLDGDASIRRRPVDRIATPLRQMGAELDATGGRFPPLTVRGAHLRAISRSRAPRSSRASCWAPWPRTAPPPSASPSAAATTPSACCCAPASTSTATAATSPSSMPTS
jgi:3-phosphoshikimate 1-carboxyvinyltransferase